MKDLILLILHKLCYRFNAILAKIPAALSAEIDKPIPKFMETQGTQNSQNNLENKEQSWSTHFLISKPTKYKKDGIGIGQTYGSMD